MSARGRRGRRRGAVSFMTHIVLFSIIKTNTHTHKTKKGNDQKREEEEGKARQSEIESNSGAVGSLPPFFLPSLPPFFFSSARSPKLGKREGVDHEPQ